MLITATRLVNRVPDQTIGRYLKKKRDELDISIRELSRKINTDPTYISSLERNKHGHIPSNKTLKKLGDALGIDLDVLKVLRRPLIESRAMRYEED